jgi:hypothetical protein
MVSVRVLKMQGARYYTAANKIVTFMNPHSAHAYKNFLERKRSIYGYFPNHSKGSETYSITIEVEDLESLQSECLNYNIGLLGVHSFEHDMYGVTMKAEELTDQLGTPIDPRTLLESRPF